MVVTSIKPQRLSARDDPDSGRSGSGGWGTIQIAAPAIVGGVLLLLFILYIIWQRKPHDKRSYDYRKARSEWLTKIERMLVPRRKRQRVLRSSGPVTLDESMRTPQFPFDFNRRSRQYRSDSSDSQTPLTATSYTFDHPSNKLSDSLPNNLSGSPLPIPKRHTVRWWWLFGSRPQQIKSEEPGQRWRVDDPDGSCSGHGHSSHGQRYAVALGPLREVLEDDGEDEVIRIGENFTSVASTPMTQHFPEQVRIIRGIPTIPEHPSSSGARTPALATSAPQSNPGTPVSSANRGLPPSYAVSQSHTRYPSAEDIVHPARSGSYRALPTSALTVGYSSPHALHGRELSSDGFLAT